MARMKTKDYSEAQVRFGRGASRAGYKGEARIGTKDQAQTRATILNFRVTDKELAAIRAAYAKFKGSESFAEFAATALLDGIATREIDMTVIGTDSGATLDAMDALRNELTVRMEAVSSGADAATERLLEVMNRQDSAIKLSIASNKVLRGLA